MKRGRVYPIALTSIMIALLPVLAQAAADRPGYWHPGWEWGWPHMIFGPLMMILFWGAIIVAIVLVVRWLGGGSLHGTAPASSRNKALEILQERFARGGIDKAEFEERKRLLSD